MLYSYPDRPASTDLVFLRNEILTFKKCLTELKIERSISAKSLLTSAGALDGLFVYQTPCSEAPHRTLPLASSAELPALALTAGPGVGGGVFERGVLERGVRKGCRVF